MKKLYFLSIGCLVAFFCNACHNNDQSKKEKKEPNINVSYFGQNPPGATAEIFAPGIVSINGRYEYTLSFSPNLDEMYFSGEEKDGLQMVLFSRLIDGKWTSPKKANFTKGRKKSEFEAFVNNKGDKIYFAAYDSIFSDESTWYVNRLENSWSDAVRLNSPINDGIIYYPNAASNGDLFYINVSKRKMYYAPFNNGEYEEGYELGIEYGIHGFVSPFQEFVLVDARKDNDKSKDKDIHACFKKNDGTWSKPINLGETVNSDFNETCPSLSPDGKYLFFSRYNEEDELSNIYWVSAEVIDKLKITFTE